MDDDSRTARWERRAGIPLGADSLLYRAASAVWILGRGLPGDARDLCLVVVGVTWAMFVVDYAVRWRLSGDGARFVHRHWLDSVVVLRPVRIVRVYDAFQERRSGQPRMPLQGRVMLYAGLSAGLLGFSAALAVYECEHTVPGASIRTFGDAL